MTMSSSAPTRPTLHDRLRKEISLQLERYRAFADHGENARAGAASDTLLALCQSYQAVVEAEARLGITRDSD